MKLNDHEKVILDKISTIGMRASDFIDKDHVAEMIFPYLDSLRSIIGRLENHQIELLFMKYPGVKAAVYFSQSIELRNIV